MKPNQNKTNKKIFSHGNIFVFFLIKKTKKREKKHSMCITFKKFFSLKDIQEKTMMMMIRVALPLTMTDG